MNVLVFDIETVPDVVAARKALDLKDLDDRDVANVMFSRRQQETDGRTEFLPHYLHRIVAIAVILRNDETLKLWSLGTPESSEAELIRRFFDGLERYRPTLVSWNGGGFDLPVLHYRSLLHGVAAPLYWETGEREQSHRWNNYLNRFHERHTDLMDVLSGYQARACASLDDIANLLGFPGKFGMSGGDVWEQYLDGNLAEIRDYCETDVLNTYLVYLRFEHIRGHLSAEAYPHEIERVRDYLEKEQKDHFSRFLAAWAS